MPILRPFSICLLTGGAILLSGCAGGPKLSLPFSKQASSNNSRKTGLARALGGKTNEELRAEQADRSLASIYSSDKSAWQRMINPEPRVTNANDPVRLASRPAMIPAEVHREAAKLHEVRGEYPKAAAFYRKALEANPNDESTLLSYARLHDREGRFDEAIQLYRRAVEAHPQSARAHNDFGLCAVRGNNAELGNEMLQRAVALDPKSVRYRNNLAQVLVGQGKTNQAIAQLNVVHPAGVAEYNVAHWLSQAGDMQQAAEWAARAVAANPQLQPARDFLARLPQQVASMPRDRAAEARLPEVTGAARNSAFRAVSIAGGPGVQLDELIPTNPSAPAYEQQSPAPIISASDL